MRHIIFFLISILYSSLSFTQEQSPKWSVKVMAGYSFKGFLPQEHSVKTITPSEHSLDPAEGKLEDLINKVDSIGFRENVHDTYSKGFSYYIGFGYALSKQWSLELGAIWLDGANINGRTVYAQHPLLGRAAVMNTKTYAWGLALNPAVNYTMEIHPKWALEARLGLMLPIYGRTVHEISIDGPNSSLGASTANIESQTSSEFSLGMTGSLSLTRKLTDRLGVFIQINAQHLNVRGKHMQIKKYNITTGGQTNDMLALFQGKYHSEINFVQQLNAQSNNPETNPTIDPNKPKNLLQNTIPFSSIGVGLGLTFSF